MLNGAHGDWCPRFAYCKRFLGRFRRPVHFPNSWHVACLKRKISKKNLRLVGTSAPTCKTLLGLEGKVERGACCIAMPYFCATWTVFHPRLVSENRSLDRNDVGANATMTLWGNVHDTVYVVASGGHGAVALYGWNVRSLYVVFLLCVFQREALATLSVVHVHLSLPAAAATFVR